MSQNSPILSLPYIQAAQAQKHVTHNEALRVLDVVTQLAVQSRTLTTPPVSPATGDRYIVPAGASGDWVGQDGKVAHFDGGSWAFVAPITGMLAFVSDETALVVFDGNWSPVQPDLTGATIDNLSGVGVGTSSDATNLISVASEASLFSHAGAGHQMKVNKNAAGDTASLLFQSAWTGHAEMGLAGSTDFSVKVSPDGSAWQTAMQVDGATAAVSFPSGGVREALIADRTWYVDPAGSDANDGLSAGAAFQTIQRAVDAAVAVDAMGHSVVIQLADGTYAGTVSIGALTGAAKLELVGNAVTPANVVLNGVGAALDLSGVRLHANGITVSGTADAVSARGGADVTLENTRFASTTGAQIVASQARVTIGAGCSVEGSASYWARLTQGAVLDVAGQTLTVNGTPSFTTFIDADRCCVADLTGSTITGAATGTRYSVRTNAVLDTGGAGATHLPGDVAGTTQDGGVYV